MEPSGKINAFQETLERLQEGGFEPSDELTALLARWKRLTNASGSGEAFDQLTQIILDGEKKGQNIETLLAEAVIQSLVQPHQVGSIVERSARLVWTKVRQLWDLEVGQAIEFFGGKLTAAGQTLVSAIEIVDPNLSAEKVIYLSEEERHAWGSMGLYSHEVSKAHELYVLAVRTVTKLESEDVHLAAIDFADSDRPAAWAALDDLTGDTRHKWTGVIQAGAVIDPAASLDDIAERLSRVTRPPRLQTFYGTRPAARDWSIVA